MQAWLVFFLKHEECIEKFTRGEYHDSEPIEGRIADAINYLLLLRAIIEEARPAPMNEPQHAAGGFLGQWMNDLKSRASAALGK